MELQHPQIDSPMLYPLFWFVAVLDLDLYRRLQAEELRISKETFDGMLYRRAEDIHKQLKKHKPPTLQSILYPAKINLAKVI